MFGFRKQQSETDGEQSPQSRPTQTAPAGAAGGQRLNLVGREQFARAIDTAVRHGIQSHFGDAGEETVEAAVSTIRGGMVHLLRQQSKAVRGLPKAAFLREVTESKRKIEAEREAASLELEKLLGQLSNSRSEVGQMEASLVAESRISGMEQDYELSQRIQGLFDGQGNSPEMDAIREQVTSLLLHQMQSERDKVIDAQMAEHRREVDNFERRITKLTSSLQLTEGELKKIAAAKGIDAGVASIFREVQGLCSDDGDVETKKELMSSIFEANLSLQKGSEVSAT